MTETGRRKTAPPRVQLANLAGLIGTSVIVLGMVISAIAYEGTLGQSYRIANHFVSELGEIGVSPLAWVFNSGLIVGGVGIVVFALGLVSRLNGWFRWIVGPFGILTGVFGALVGVFPMNTLATHIFVANGFFYPGLATMLLFSGYALASRHQEFSRWIALPGLLAAGALFGFLFLGETIENLVDNGGPPPNFGANRPAIWVGALFEWVAIGAVLAWTLVVALMLAARDRQTDARAV